MSSSNTSKFVLDYFWGNLICSLASLISFPIFTRVLSVSDYGVFVLVTSTLTMMIVFSKMGIQNAIVRFYPEANIEDKGRRSEFHSTYFFSLVVIGFSALIVYVAIVPFLTKDFFNLKDSWPFYAAALLIPAHGIYSAFGNFFRARQEPVLFNIITILDVYSPLILGFLFMFFFGTTVANFLLGCVVAKALYLTYFGRRFHGEVGFSRQSVSRELLKRSVTYGIPLMLLEFSANMLAYGDRFIIKYYLETTDVAIYSVGYNLAVYMANVFVTPINNTLQVEYIAIWTRDGRQKTEEYLSGMCKAIMYFGAIFCVIMLLNFKYILIFFATSKYLESVRIAPYVITSVMAYSLFPVFGAGIYLSKTTKNLFYCVVAALVVNILANIVLIPRLGILGAAISTFVANSLAALLIYLVGHMTVKIRIKFKYILICLVAAMFAYILGERIELNNFVLNVGTRSLISFVLYSAIMMSFDSEYKYRCSQVYYAVKSRILPK